MYSSRTFFSVFMCILFPQEIQSLMLKGRISQSIGLVNRLYPTLLNDNKELMFRILCRQFIEIVSGCDKMEDESSEEINGEVAMDTDEVDEEKYEDSSFGQ